jgi:uncharacterized membrane protein YfcA
MSAALLAAVAVLVGFFIGSVGVGGVLLIPALALLGGVDGPMSIHHAAATALISFFFTGLLGSWLFYRRGSMDWRMALPVCAGSVLFSYLGALLAARVAPRPLTLLIAAIIVFAGVYVLLPSRRADHGYRDGRGAAQQGLLAGVGAVAGLGSGLSGAGGALFSVPMMMALGFAPLAAIGTSQVLQIVVAASGTAGTVQQGFVDWRVAALVSAFQLGGVMLGTRAAHAVSGLVLRRLAGALCVASAGLLLWRTL